MATNTNYDPQNVKDFVKTALNFDAQGVVADIPVGTNPNIDLKVVGDHLITGADVLVKNATFNDYVIFQVIDVDGKYYPAGSMLSQFVTNWYMREDSQLQINLEVSYPAKIKDGLYLRMIYHSTATSGSDPQVAINYTLHKILSGF